MKIHPANTFAFAFLFPLLAAAQPLGNPPYIVAQSDYGGENGNMGGETIGYPYAQTFTASRSGTLNTLSAGFYAPQTGIPSYYIFQFRATTAAGLPDSHIIASVNQSTAVLNTPANAWIDLTADFSSFGIGLQAGHKYAFSVDQPGQAGVTTQNNFFWGFTGSGYAGGETYFFPTDGTAPRDLFPGEDFLFTVTAVPEPAMLAPLCCVCTLLWFGWRRRNNSFPRPAQTLDCGL